ncbi:MAG TPA: tRNA (N6-isopentenyl adenosine(37)-C2)-methylthiotransferase MiaB [Chitinophagaceae bacterium]|jgi:tRNA-2-methylthio-N6-dimethylallyladenosine synthase|nr:tRNA (N6-isopentenyl adenosine(37)-C2)-methylthiotransferase MiaB [Chitinophagaceae bacterium]HMX77936.1 tRNA (N6-isopentenyl adenosine(37)-C2)-methylthiotransferase MiaB [Chitinophagaceae bacterium]HNA19143.1 tRNA (N6-isopentenyl adenosine(37)-C2)-methylthiotransferase MiaB [Chitinophagaceae bacterium]HNA92505.1 tRNA (N6-isopentenyl adenosine(37)-C2)-methylthiotransferase MiaB [Chitinophagaceae bacterium]HNF47261.1 tRNA (N6-isopentenyl adenosine(37)-C2)-methylthiotransferase MiaB [Chitinoph
MIDLMTDKKHDELRQGEAYAPFANDPNHYHKRFYIESYGCQMNFSDSEIVASILNKEGFGATRNVEEADLIFLNTCSIREKAEQTVRKRLTEFKKLKQQKKGMLVGVLGCMAERLKSKFLEEEKLVDIVVGPDAYRSLPELVNEAEQGQKAVNVLLSREETYADISPVRLDSNGVTAFVSIMRGCNNMCTFCVVPFTRGRERSRDAASIIAECKDLFDRGFKEVTLLGQNVDSYHYALETNEGEPTGSFFTFAMLLEAVAKISPLLRVRFSTSHPKDITDDVLHTMAKYENICKYIHLPVQSGSSRILQLMNRTYTKEWYLAKVDRIRQIIPDCGISSDIITGFCTEEEKDHQETLEVMEYSRYDMSYMFAYSERPGTLAERRYKDDVPDADKKRRLTEIVETQNRLSLESNQRDIGKSFTILIEGDSKKSADDWMGRSSQNKVIVFPKEKIELKKGDYVTVKVTDCTQATLIGKMIQ